MVFARPRGHRRRLRGRQSGSAAATPSRASLAAIAALLLLLGSVLAGCGLRPLYGEGPASVSQETLGSIRINPVRDRLGQLLHNRLRDRLNPRGQPLEPDYVLAVSVRERTKDLSFRKDETATRAQLTLTASFALTDAQSGERLLRGRSFIVNSFNVLDSQYATLAAEEDARSRGVRELADDITAQVASFIAQRGRDRRG